MGGRRGLGQRRSRGGVFDVSRKLPRVTTTRQRSGRDAGPVGDALKDVCTRALAAIPLDDDGAKNFFEDNFTPLRINSSATAPAFSPAIRTHYRRLQRADGSVQAPLYRRPQSGRLRAAQARRRFPSKGVKVGRRVGRRKIVPYYDRGEIENGALDGWHLEICWLHDPVDVLFAQIQGSARIRLEDGTILRVNYDSHNGWPYTPVGRVLIHRKVIAKDDMSMQRIHVGWTPIRIRPKRCGRRTILRFLPHHPPRHRG